MLTSNNTIGLIYFNAFNRFARCSVLFVSTYLCIIGNGTFDGVSEAVGYILLL